MNEAFRRFPPLQSVDLPVASVVVPTFNERDNANMAPAGASHSAATMYHAWFAHGTRWQQVTEQLPGPPPGFLVGGPNPQFSTDACCRAPAGSRAYRCYGATTFSLCERNFAPPLAQPPAKSYLQFNDLWPANSWEISEPSLSYQSYYVRLLASFTR